VRLGCWTAAHVRGLHGLDVDRVVCAHQRERGLVVKVATLPTHVLMLLGALPDGLCTALAALFATRDALLRFLELTLSRAVGAGFLPRLPVRRDEKHLQAHINARLVSGERQWLDWHLGTRATHIPAIRLPRDGDGLDAALDRPGPAHGDTANLAE